jgi:hypothetical protein
MTKKKEGEEGDGQIEQKRKKIALKRERNNNCEEKREIKCLLSC